MSRSTYLTTLFAVCALALGCSAYAETKDFNVPGGALKKALSAYVKQTGIQLVYKEDDVKGVRTQGVSGALSPEDALARILAGTQLIAHRDSSGAIAIVAGGARSTTSLNSLPQGMKVAQAGQAMQKVATGKSDEAAKEKVAVTEESVTTKESAESTKGIPEILVKGSRSMNTDIERTRDDIQPYVVFDRETLMQSQAANLEDFFRTRLTMDTQARTNAQTRFSYSGTQSAVNLRGLGNNQTLLLVNGRRLVSGASGIATAQPDVNAIPLASIERVEILPSTAGGIYGGGATGGVINIITRKGYAGLEAGVMYGNTADSVAPTRRFDVNGGLNFEDGRTHVLFNASHTFSDALQVGERSFEAAARALMLKNNPGALLGNPRPPYAYTGNISSTPSRDSSFNLIPGPPLVLKNGTPLNSTITFIPVGYSGTADGGAALLANAGRYNLDPPAGLGVARASLLPQSETASASFNLQREFGSRVIGFIEGSWTSTKSESSTGYDPNFLVTLPAAATNNPFTTSIDVSTPGLFARPSLRGDVETRRAAGGVIVRLPHDWSLGADYSWNRFRASQTSVDLQSYFDFGIYTDMQNGTLDVMRDINIYPIDPSPYLRSPRPAVTGPFVSNLGNAVVRVSGPAAELPGGAVVVTAGLERGDTKVQPTLSTGEFAFLGVTYFSARSQSVNSAHLEARVPLVSERNAMTGVRSLEGQASVRYDDYNSVANSPMISAVLSREGPFPATTEIKSGVEANSYTLGLKYSPLADLTFRASFGTGFLPPDINQTVPGAPSNVASLFLSDPRRGNVPTSIGPILLTRNRNPELKPEDSRSLSAGMIVSPRSLPGLRLSVDYTKIEKLGEIGSLDYQTLLNLESVFPERITRAPLTASDQALGYTGGIVTGIDYSLLNFSKSTLEAYDTQMDYEMDLDRFGRLHFFAMATWQPSLKRSPAPTLPLLESVGLVDGPLKWRANAGLIGERGPWTVRWSTQFYNHYLIYRSFDTSQARARSTVVQGSDSMPRQLYHDIFVGYRTPSAATWAWGLFANTTFGLGIQNLFDSRPPVLLLQPGNPEGTLGSFLGNYSPYGDPRLRRYTLTLRRSF